MDTQRFVDRMLETENLTDELEDADAQRLLDWGFARLESLLDGIEDPEAAGEKVNALMALMRKLNRLAGGAAGGDPQMLAGELARLDELSRALYPDAGPRDPQTCQQAALELSALEPGPALDYLLAWPGAAQTSTDS
jgi:hypothetical protein